jgi:hypothetical protein
VLRGKQAGDHQIINNLLSLLPAALQAVPLLSMKPKAKGEMLPCHLVAS